jgi:hypothetical protein
MKSWRLPARGFVISLLFSTALLAQSHESRFELAKAFLTDWAHHPIRDVAVNLHCDDPQSKVAGPVHDEANDCELHIGALLADPSISDFQGVVLEPPNVCVETGKNWRTFINTFRNRDCVARGFVRVWPEHLTSGSGCSNPNHFMEVHPLQTLTCGDDEVLDFTSKLRVVEDLGYKPVSTVRLMMGLKLWVCQGCPGAPSESGIQPLSFDYCFGSGCTRPQASNFARFKVRVIRGTIRPEQGRTLEGFATAIARVLPVGLNGQASGSRYMPLKFYALQGSEFYDKLLAMRGDTGNVPTLDVIGIFTVDPFSVLKVIEREGVPSGEWVNVPFPVALIVFGET